MSKRSLETLTDVLVLIVSPMLVMILVGSLAFFLIQCFYTGQFFGRLNFATGLFVMAAVLVARIAIEDGREYASAFALPLGVVTILSILQYTDIGGFLAVPLVLFIWWSTDKLTWDCTVLDENKDASGEGLLQTIGLDERSPDADDDATTDRAQTDTKSLWQGWLERRRRHHTPGVWVIYFGLAAIPLFGIGQTVLADRTRGAGFLLLCTYVAAALALLMITSFLQMRRYLIQRRLPFSEKMAAIWLGTGGTIIIALMVFALLLPRPNTGYSMVDTLTETLQADSEDDKSTSDWAVGNEGVEREDSQGRQTSQRADSEPGPTSTGNPQQDRSQAAGNDGRQASNQDRGESDTSESNSGNSSSDKPSPADSRRDQNQPADARDAARERSGDASDNSSSDQRGDSTGDRDGERANHQERDANQRPTDPQQQRREQAATDRPDDQSHAADSRPNKPRFQPPSMPQPLKNLSLPPIPKLVYWLLVLLGVLVLLYFYGQQIMAALAAFWRDLSSLFFGKKKPAAASDEEEVPEAPPSQPFRSFRDPFASGMAGRLSPQQLVAYTFEALQAWASEHECARQDDQTPLEFAGQVARTDRSVGPHAKNLAILYNQAAYAPSTLGTHAVEHVKALWIAMRKR